MSPTTTKLAEKLITACLANPQKPLMIATAESCTAGLISAAITDVAGSSAVFDRGFVTYSNQAKMDMLDVPETLLAKHGAVSEAVACAMARGTLQNSLAEIAVSVTGIAGPGGGSPQNPVGLVHFGLASSGHEVLHKKMQFGDLGRAAVREKTVETALQMMIDALENEIMI